MNTYDEYYSRELWIGPKNMRFYGNMLIFAGWIYFWLSEMCIAFIHHIRLVISGAGLGKKYANVADAHIVS